MERDAGRGALQRQRAAVVTEAAPFGQRLGRSRRRESLDGREPLDESRKAFGDARRLGLLQHHLADQHPIRVVDAAPGEVAMFGRVPVEEATAHTVNRRRVERNRHGSQRSARGLGTHRSRTGALPLRAMRYRLLCLDAGFTILSPRNTLADALSDAMAAQGHEITQEELHAGWEEADRWFWDEYHRPGNDTWSDDGRIEEYWRQYHGVILERLGVDVRRDVLDRILASQFAADAWELYPDVEPMLQAVRAMDGVTVGIVSDWGSNLRSIITQLELDQYLDFVLPSGSVGVAKPNPAFFRMALEHA